MIPKIYLDACCICRPFDDLSHPRIRMESEAVIQILSLVKEKRIIWMTSEVLAYEIENIEDIGKKRKILPLLKYAEEMVELEEETLKFAVLLNKEGFSEIDGLHIACAKASGAEYMLTTDDKLKKRAVRNEKMVGISVDNPLDWVINKI